MNNNPVTRRPESENLHDLEPNQNTELDEQSRRDQHEQSERQHALAKNSPREPTRGQDAPNPTRAEETSPKEG